MKETAKSNHKELLNATGKEEIRTRFSIAVETMKKKYNFTKEGLSEYLGTSPEQLVKCTTLNEVKDKRYPNVEMLARFIAQFGNENIKIAGKEYSLEKYLCYGTLKPTPISEIIKRGDF